MLDWQDRLHKIKSNEFTNKRYEYWGSSNSNMKQGNKMFFYVISVAFGWKAEFVIAVFAKQKNIFWVHDLQKLFRSTLNTYLCESGCKNCSFFGKFGVFCFLETPVLRFALLAYYRRNMLFHFFMVHNISPIMNLQSWTKYLRQTVIFM